MDVNEVLLLPGDCATSFTSAEGDRLGVVVRQSGDVLDPGK
jgi:hypothetical protein